MLMIIGKYSTIPMMYKGRKAITFFIVDLVLNHLISIAAEILKSPQHSMDLIPEYLCEMRKLLQHLAKLG